MGEIVAMSANAPEIAQEEITFDDFWTLYPRRVAKKDAARAWGRVPASEHATVLTALVAWRRIWERRGELEYVPYPASWLNGERWTDELPTSAGPAVAAHMPAKLPERGAKSEMPEHVRAAIAKIRSVK